MNSSVCTMNSKKLKCLSVQEKLKILEEVDNGILKKKQIALNHGIPPNTLSTIIKNRGKLEQLVNCHGVDTIRQRSRLSIYEEINEAMYNWIHAMIDQNLPLNDLIVRRKAQEFGTVFGREKFTASVGWLDKFKRRYNILRRSSSGDNGNLDKTMCCWQDVKRANKKKSAVTSASTSKSTIDVQLPDIPIPTEIAIKLEVIEDENSEEGNLPITSIAGTPLPEEPRSNHNSDTLLQSEIEIKSEDFIFAGEDPPEEIAPIATISEVSSLEDVAPFILQLPTLVRNSPTKRPVRKYHYRQKPKFCNKKLLRLTTKKLQLEEEEISLKRRKVEAAERNAAAQERIAAALEKFVNNIK